MCLTIFQKGKKRLKTIKIKIENIYILKNWDFSKGVSPWFWQKKVKPFHLFIFGKKKQNSQQNVFEEREEESVFRV